MSDFPAKLTYEQLRAVNVERVKMILEIVGLPADITSHLYGSNELLIAWAYEVLDDPRARIHASRLPIYMPIHTLARLFGASPPKHDWGTKHIWVTLYNVFQYAKATALDHDNYTIHSQIEKSTEMVSHGTDCDLPDKIGGVTHTRDVSVTARPLPAGPAPAMAAEAAAADHSAAAASSCATVSGEPSPPLMSWDGRVGDENVETFTPINVI